MSSTAQEIFERYIWAGMTRNAGALAEMFTQDGVFEAPLVPAGHAFPRRPADRVGVHGADLGACENGGLGRGQLRRAGRVRPQVRRHGVPILQSDSGATDVAVHHPGRLG
ncbi:hypothetical protein FHR32_006820 [Streptosporangium album]|uniref:SnoaL-like domain-containing protein n=1 Tax=Streptosporangium album TaxID=47479 RepID=A0A7W7WDK6_9ACTN|nr:hypothetical protein [Streptosporangium album]MBB4942434.1 hypothetical protein [Streptosporangium album]